MKALIPMVFLLAGSAAFAQYRGYGGYGGYGGIRPQPYGSVTGFGSVLYPGLGHAPFPGSGTGTVLFPSGMRGGVFNGRLGKPGPRYGGYGYVAPYPVFVGPYYGYDGDAQQQQQQQQQQPQTIVIQQPAAAPAPAAPNVTINQYFRSDGTPEAGPEAQSGQASVSRTPAAANPAPARHPAADDEATIYLIAYKDQTIIPALAYWVEGDTLNYITREGTHNRASMALIDRDFSRRLNNERQVEFSLP